MARKGSWTILEIASAVGVAVLGYLGYRQYEKVKPGDSVTIAYSLGAVTGTATMLVTSVASDGSVTGSISALAGLPAGTPIPAGPITVPALQVTKNLTPRLTA